MDASVKRVVRERADNCCEYCRLKQEQSPLFALQIEHIRPRKHHGDDEIDNLALACIDCNLHKGPNLAGIDAETGTLIELFHPRQHAWDDHFELQGPLLFGKTPIGRVTIDVLNMNSDDQVALRTLAAQPKPSQAEQRKDS
jgi:HNH endonuclease